MKSKKLRIVKHGGRWRKASFLSFLLLSCFLLFPFNIFHLTFPISHSDALDVPPLRGYVNDYANMISPRVRTKLEAELKSFEKSDSTQIVILTIPSLKGEVLEEFSMKVAETWKIGQKGKDNGIILLVAREERKIRIEVGRGLEGRLTDLMAGRVIDFVVRPLFKRGDFDAGFIAGVSSLIDATRGEFKVDDKVRKAQKPAHQAIPTLLIFGGIALFVLGRISRIVGAMAGAIGFPLIVYMIVGSIPLSVLIFFSIVGLVMGIVVPLFGGHRGGVYWGGGSWGSGGHSSGGFGGGFSGGGGGFGGGGASGNW